MHSSRLLALLIRKRYPAKALLGSDPKWHPGRRCSEFGLWEPKKDRQDRCAQVISNFPNCFLQIGQFVKFDWVRSTHHAAFPRSMAELSAGRPHNGHQINSITFHSPATALPHRVDTYPGVQWAVERTSCHMRNGAVLLKSLAPVRKTRKEAEYRDY